MTIAKTKFILLACGLWLSSSVWAATETSPPILDADDDTPTTVEDVPIEQIQNFIEAFTLIKNNYVDALDDKELFENAMHGLAENLDPYSRYLDAEKYKQLVEFTEGQIAEPQLKLSFDSHKNYWQIAEISRNSENYRQGLRKGQIVERINGVNIQNLDQRAVRSLLTGSLGSIANLRVKENGHTHIYDVVRDQKLNYDVQGAFTEHHILLIKILAFQQNTTKQVESLLKKYQDQQIQGILIDIRDNPGGLLSAAVDLADLFLEQGLIVSTKSRIDPPQKFQALPSQQPMTYPIVILQNRFSASAAEVFSAAMQSHHRAKIVGETSYGKGAVQKLFPLQQGGALQLTVSHYYTPAGEMIEGKGIEPDINIDMGQGIDEQDILRQALATFTPTNSIHP